MCCFCKKLQKSYDFIIVSVIAPFSLTRKKAKKEFGNNYIEIYVNASLKTVIKRDTKGLYRKAIAGKIKNLIGLDSSVPYDEPDAPDLVLYTDKEPATVSFNKLIKFLNTIIKYE